MVENIFQNIEFKKKKTYSFVGQQNCREIKLSLKGKSWELLVAGISKEKGCMQSKATKWSRTLEDKHCPSQCV